MASIPEIFASMAYGPAPESTKPAEEWLDRHGRRFGMFIVTVPKEFSRTQKIYWTLAANGTTTSVPFHMHTDYNITPAKSSEESPTREFNTPTTRGRDG